MPAALWWAVVTLTTTGYGDEVPHTALGHLLGSVVMICGIATFGLWTGILATGFASESRRRNFIETWDLVSKVPFFQTLDPTAITEITHMLRRVEIPERTAVIRRGRVGDCMYFIAAGEVEVDVMPTPVRLGVGAFFGEMALLGEFDPQRQCRDHQALDIAHSRLGRFPQADGALFRARPRHRRRGQKAAGRKSAAARIAFARRRCVVVNCLRHCERSEAIQFAGQQGLDCFSHSFARNDAVGVIAIFL